MVKIGMNEIITTEKKMKISWKNKRKFEWLIANGKFATLVFDCDTSTALLVSPKFSKTDNPLRVIICENQNIKKWKKDILAKIPVFTKEDYESALKISQKGLSYA